MHPFRNKPKHTCECGSTLHKRFVSVSACTVYSLNLALYPARSHTHTHTHTRRRRTTTTTTTTDDDDDSSSSSSSRRLPFWSGRNRARGLCRSGGFADRRMRSVRSWVLPTPRGVRDSPPDPSLSLSLFTDSPAAQLPSIIKHKRTHPAAVLLQMKPSLRHK